jgi:hypothetical protein
MPSWMRTAASAASSASGWSRVELEFRLVVVKHQA